MTSSDSRLTYRSETTDLSSAFIAARPVLYRRLRRAGASHDIAEDLIQDIATKALAKKIAPGDLLRWGTHVGRQLLIDERRLARRRPAAALHDDHAAEEDAATTAVLAVDAARAWLRLEARDREALQDDELPNLYVRRFRARAGLARLLGAVMGVLHWVRAKAERLRPVMFEYLLAAVVGLVVVARTLSPEPPPAPPTEAATAAARGPRTPQEAPPDPTPPNTASRSASEAAAAHSRGPSSVRALAPPPLARFPTHVTITVTVPSQPHPVADAGTRPADGEQPLACAQAPTAGRICVDRFATPSAQL